MNPDIGFVAGMNDAQLMRSFAQMEARTRGFIHSINRAVAPLQQSFGLLRRGTVLFGAGALLQQFAQYSQRNAEIVREELATRERIRDVVEQTITAQIRAGQSSEYTAAVGESESFTARRAELLKAQSEARRAIENDTNLLGRVVRFGTRVGRGFGSLITGDLEVERERQQTFDATTASLRTLEQEQAKAIETRRQMAQETTRLAEEERKLAQIRESLRANEIKADAMSASGDVFGSRRLQEAVRHARELQRIMELIRKDSTGGVAQLDAELQRNRANRGAIDRDQADESARTARENRLREISAAEDVLSRKRMSDQQEVERLRLTGMDKEAKALELLIEHEKRLLEIRTTEGLRFFERQQMIDNEAALYQMRLSGLDSGGGGFTRRGAPVGLSSGSAVAQVFGVGGENAADRRHQETRRNQERGNSILAEMNQKLGDLVRRSGAAVFA